MATNTPSLQNAFPSKGNTIQDTMKVGRALQTAQGTTDIWNAGYMAGPSDPRDQLGRGIKQQQAVYNKFFLPQYKKAISFGLNEALPNQEAIRAGDAAANTNLLNREQYLRMQERQQAAIDPTVAAETNRLSQFQDAKNIANASNMAWQGTKDYQQRSLGDLAGLTMGTARQGLGLAVQAANSAQNRETMYNQAKMQQQQAQQAQMQAGISGAIGAISAAASAYAALSALAAI